MEQDITFIQTSLNFLKISLQKFDGGETGKNLLIQHPFAKLTKFAYHFH